MYIPSYQIHNVLKVYTKQLSQGRFLDRKRGVEGKSTMDKINLSAEGKRQAIIEKVAADIVERITNYGPQDDVEHQIVDTLREELGENVDFATPNTKNFVFNVINGKNEKIINTFSVEDTDFIIRRLEQLAKKAVDENMQQSSINRQM